MSSDSGKNDPLPRMSKTDAQSWAKHFTESMARDVGVNISPETIRSHFFDCVGRNDEIVDDGRYNLYYYARVALVKDRQLKAVETIRKSLEERGYEILGFQNDAKANPSVIMDARSPEKDFGIRVEGHKLPESLLFSIITPCLLPPGVEQKEL